MTDLSADGANDVSRHRAQRERARAARTERVMLVVTTALFTLLAAGVLVAWVRSSLG